MAEALAARDGSAVFLAIDRVVEAGHDPRRFAMDLLDRLRDLIVLAAVAGAGAPRTAASTIRSRSRSSKNRKSTRLNSNHTMISYAGFCLKKKNIGAMLNMIVST